MSTVNSNNSSRLHAGIARTSASPSTTAGRRESSSSQAPRPIDEHSAGRGGALRRAATKLLGSNILGASVAAPSRAQAGVVDPADLAAMQKAAVAVQAAVNANKATGAAAVMTSAMTAAVSSIQGSHPDWPKQRIMDDAMATIHATLVGDHASELQMIANAAGADGRPDVIAKSQALKNGPPVLAPMTHITGAGDMRPTFNDLTNNQVYHSMFFVVAGYIAGTSQQANTMAGAGGLWHELAADPTKGYSKEDLLLTLAAISVGRDLSVQKDTSSIENLMKAVFSSTGGDAAVRARYDQELKTRSQVIEDNRAVFTVALTSGKCVADVLALIPGLSWLKGLDLQSGLPTWVNSNNKDPLP